MMNNDELNFVEKLIDKYKSEPIRERKIDSVILFVVLMCYKYYFPVNDKQSVLFNQAVLWNLQKLQDLELLDGYSFNLIDTKLFINVGFHFPVNQQQFTFDFNTLDEINEITEILVKEFNVDRVLTI